MFTGMPDDPAILLRGLPPGEIPTPPANKNRPYKKMPHFIIIGTKKCGTGALRQMLPYHSKIKPPK